VTSYLVVFVAAAVATYAATPLVRRLSIRVGAIAQPSDRRVHERPTPSMGGVAMFVGVLLALAVAAALPFFDDLGRSWTQWLAVLVATGSIVFLGAIDDIKGLSAPSKLAGQIFAGGLLALGGVQLLFFLFPGQGVLSLSSDLAVPLTILLVVSMVNAINLIDGLDGLAAGIVAIAAASFFAYMYRSPGAFGDASAAALLAAVAAGVAVGFLPWNFNPARIFMGDSGAMLLGMLLAVATIFGVGRNPYPPTGGDLAILALPIFLPVLVLAIPFLDVALAILRRVRRGTGVAHADKEHIHHRLLDVGHSHRRAVLLLYLWSALISACALAVAFVDSRAVVVAVALGAVVVFLATSLPLLISGRTAGSTTSAPGASSGGDPAARVERPPAGESARAGSARGEASPSNGAAGGRPVHAEPTPASREPAS
jgi:UDP-GlcNAc:undecaprenyl-phosphate/decaprenyl-phosphate GlcNAc-1-phosphate transferase